MANQGGYNAGSIYVDLVVQGANATKTLDEYMKKIQQLEKKERTYMVQKKALEQILVQEKLIYGENSKQVKEVEKKLTALASKERLLKNEISVLNKAMKQQSSIVVSQNQALKQQATNAQTAAHAFRSMSTAAMSPAAGIAQLTTSLNTLKIAILGVAAHRLYDALIVPGAELEQTITSLDVLLGSYEKAQKLTDNLIVLAAKTPLVTSDLTAGAKQLLAANVALEDIEGTLEMLGDVAMGSSETFESLVSAYAKIQTAGRAQLRNLYSFTTAGVPIIDALVESLNISKEEFYDLSRAGQISAKDVEKALASLTEEGGRFADMMDRQSKTYSGLLSTVKDNFEILAQKVGDEALNQLKDSLTGILEEIERLEKTGELEVIIKQWGGAFADLVSGLSSAVKFLYDFRETVIAVIGAFAGYKVVGFAAKSLASFISIASSAAGPLSSLAISLARVWNTQKEVMAELDSGYSDLISKNEKLVTSFNTKITELDIQKKQADDLAKSLKELSEQEELDTDKKEELYYIIQDLNDMYPNLNLKLDEESNKLNRNIEDITAYIEAMKGRSEAIAYLDLAESLRPQILETETAIKLIEEQIDNITNASGQLENKTLGDAFEEFLGIGEHWDDTIKPLEDRWSDFVDNIKGEVVTYNVAEKTLEDLHDERDKLIEQLSHMRKEYESYFESAVAINRAESENAEMINKLEQSWANADKTIEDVRDDFQALVESLDEAKKEFDGIFDKAIDELDELTDILEQEGEALKLTESEAMKLAKTYPQLADKIKVTSDSFEIERDTIEKLKTARIEEAKLAVESQIEMTEKAIEATKNRISMYNTEVLSITTLAEAQMYLAQTQAELQLNAEPKIPDELSPFSSTTTGIRDIQERNEEDARQWVTLMERLEGLNSQYQSYMKQLEITLANIEESSKKAGETAEEAAIRRLKYRLDMEEITYQEYYDTLEKMKDEYYATGTKQWQQYTLEIYKGRKKLEEDNAKAELQAYEDRLKNSYSWIEDEEFYGRLGGQGLVDAYNRIKTYTKEYYDDGKISYERYVEEIKKLDKQIYSSMKDNLKTSNDELSDLRKKRYDEAVKQVEDYYDALEKAEEDSERRKQLKELQSQLELYEGAVTRAGQEKYKEISEDIEDIRKEGERAAREVEKQSKLEELERTYNSLEETQNAYFESVLTYSSDVTERIQQMTQLVNSAFSSITDILSGVSGTTNNNTSYQTIINQNNNINSEASGRAIVQMTDILYRYTPNRF